MRSFLLSAILSTVVCVTVSAFGAAWCVDGSLPLPAIAGVPLPTLQNLVRHTSIQATMLYVHLIDRRRRDAVESLRLLSLTEVEQKVVPMPSVGKR